MTKANKLPPFISHLLWFIVAILGAFALGYIALQRGETINAVWILIAAICVYLIGYRYYSLYIARNALQLDSTRMTPAWRHNDGLDYVPTNKSVLFGHHFAAIAGAGPLVGPVLAAQMGYLPGMIWLLAGCIFAGAVQDFVVLFISSRRDGRSLGELVKDELGTIPGIVALVACYMIMVILLAVLAMVVVTALTHSPWGTFTVIYTVPLAIFMGIYLRYIRPGRVLEVSIIGVVLLILGIQFGGYVAAHESWSKWFNYDGVSLTWGLIVYGFVAAVLPVWLLLAPRDYLSTFLKLGAIITLAIGIFIVAPEMKMPALTQFTDGTGPVWKGDLFPFLFITIACGAVSGFHALISSGTTPKMLNNEADARAIGYGGMIMESFVAIMALVAASIIDPGVYFVMNSPLNFLNPENLPDVAQAAAHTVSNIGFTITPELIHQVASDVGENTIISRAGGAPTLAVGMAHILHAAFSSFSSMPFWYHFAILFEALFILTAVDAGTRSARFMLQDFLGLFHKGLSRTDSLPANLLATFLVVLSWGYFLYQGVVDPLGGINTLWPLFGITNQMLAAIALMLCTVVLFKSKRQRYAWVTIVPSIALIIFTMSAAWIKVVDDKIGFFGVANNLKAKFIDVPFVPQGAFHSVEQAKQAILGNQINGVLTIIFMLTIVIIAFYTIKAALASLKKAEPHSAELPYEPLPESASQVVH
ncbi:carbon starvation CstA family protein [Brackiella oedipodis]|uniref:carbon starvation CstA family protein n=1 Tax=Brackiella oedipodis TaxID=124225 RepID=UPI000A03A1EE|nr:carbon starvation CstA family protein [Brackiella oedipodis]